MVSALVVVNVLSNRVVPRFLYVPFAVAVSGLLIAFAVRVDGRSWEDLGFGRGSLRRGLTWGGVLAGIVTAVYLVGVALPSTRDLFRDDRVLAMSLGDVLYAAFVRVPLGTVLLEEVAFRAVLPAVLMVRMGRWKAIGASAALFGLWHVLPSLGLETVNPVAEDTVGQLPSWVTVIGSVLSTAAVGVWFSFLRERTDSVITPMVAHWSTNALGYLFAYAVINA